MEYKMKTRSSIFLGLVCVWCTTGCFGLIDYGKAYKGSCAATHPGKVTSFDKCYPKMFNSTKCDICHDVNSTAFRCSTQNTTADRILEDIPSNISYLILTVFNQWEGHLPLTVSPINLTQIQRMANLQRLEIRQYDYSYGQLYPLIFDEDTFKPLTGLQELSIRIPLEDRDLGNIVAPLTSLEIFDVSYTRGLSLVNLTKTLGQINKSTIRYLCLRTFQLIGGDGYSFELNLRNLTGDMSPILNLTEIDLSDNSLARIEPGMYQLAPNLTKIDFSGNLLLDSHNVPLILEGLIHPKLEEFNVGYQGYVGGTHPIDTSPRHLYITQSEKNSHHFNYNNAFIMNCINVISNGNLSITFSNGTKMCAFFQCVAPVQFKGIPCELFPPMNETYEYDCFLYNRIPLGQHLKIFLFGNIHWEESSTRGLSIRDNLCFVKSALETIVFSSNSKWLKAGKIEYILNHITSISGIVNLTQLILDENDLSVNLSFLTFAHFRNLQKLDLSYNQMQMKKDFHFCENMANLLYVNLSSNYLSEIPSKLITNCTLLKQITLTKNNFADEALTNWDLNATDNLELIDLSYNKLNLINSVFQSKLASILSNKTIHLNLNIFGNPLSCGCDQDAIDFIEWMKAGHSMLKFVDFDKYTCSGQKGLQFVDQVNVNELKKICNKSNLVPILTGVCSSVLVLLLTVTVYSMVTFRWRLKYYLHQCKERVKKCCCWCGETMPTGNYRYDAFVSYCSDDRFWVHEVLMKTLENKYGFRLCIHYRDFPVGGSIFHTVVDHMNNSKIIILVVSNFYINRNICQFEIEEAQKQTVDQRKQILVIKLGAITRPVPNPDIAFLLDRHTHLEWSDDQKAHTLFWAKLVGHLYDNFQGTSNPCCCPYGARSIGYEEV